MGKLSSQNPLDSMNRRKLLGSGAAALMGSALASLAAKPEDAHAQQKLKAQGEGSQPTAKNSLPVLQNLNPPIVQVKGGKLRGFRDGKTQTFLGIRYAEAERFELPKPVQPWEGIKDAQAWGPISPIPALTAPGRDAFVFPHRYWLENEHCQVLNIWTQSLDTRAKKPVMVWMHGGGFTNGSSMEAYAYDGKNLSEFGDVVVVSLNHRLNILGTLDLSAYGPEYANSRYTGTADLVSALQWVQENIGRFGGDPGNVTIFGQSGGGGKVVRMMHMPTAQGLFHKVAAHSGGNLNFRETNPVTSIKTQQMIADATLKNLGFDDKQIDKLKKVRYQDLITAGTAALQTVAKQLGRQNLGWDVIADDKYMMSEFCDWAHGIPFIAGTVYSERAGTLGKDVRKNEWNQQEIDRHLTAEYGDKKNDVIVEYKKAFPRKKVQDVLYYNTLRSGVKQTLARKLEKARTPVYNYVFAYEYPVNGGITSFHCSELVFVFHNVGQPQS